MEKAEYSTLGRTDLRVSGLALGAMTFGTDWGWGTDKDTARKGTCVERIGHKAFEMEDTTTFLADWRAAVDCQEMAIRSSEPLPMISKERAAAR